MRQSATPSRQCAKYRDLLAAAADGHEMADLSLYRHLRSCATCRARLVEYRRLRRSLSLLAPSDAVTPPGGAATRGRRIRSAARARAHDRMRAAAAVAGAGATILAVVAGASARARMRRSG